MGQTINIYVKVETAQAWAELSKERQALIRRKAQEYIAKKINDERD